MASSSVSQESLDRDDYEYCARRSRARVLRTRAPPLHKSCESYEPADSLNRDQNGDHHDYEGAAVGHGLDRDHESPTRTSSRLKDKRGRPNHLHKGKTAKDKRKLREKRRSTGVVHLPSTESTGDSLDDEDDDKLREVDTKKNTSYNEVIDADNPQTPVEERASKVFTHRNKSPSDLEADLEDNQDYDSTVSQSETNLTIIGQSSLSGSQNNSSNSCKPRLRCSEHSSHYVYSSQRDDSGGLRGGFSARYRERDWDHGNEFDTIRPTYSIRARREQKELDEAGGAASILSENAKAAAKARELEQALEKEREENKRLKSLLEVRDLRINELERELTLMLKDLDQLDGENEMLQAENQALIRAMRTLSV